MCQATHLTHIVQTIEWDFDFPTYRIVDNFIEKRIRGKENTILRIHLYYSIVDLYGLFNETFILNTLTLKPQYFNSISSRNNLKGHFDYKKFHCQIYDMCGWDKTGLQNLQHIVGYQSNYKQIFQGDKSKMENECTTLEKAQAFMDYAIEDVISLQFIKNKMLEKMNHLYTETYGFPPEFQLTADKLPSTIGSLGANFLEKFIYNEMSKNEEGVFCRRLFEQFDQYNESMGLNKKKTLKYNLEKRLSLNQQSTNRDLFLNSAGAKSLAQNYSTNTGILNALVQSGRAINERPHQIHHTYLADIDFKSCYASGLMDFDYPVGLPTVFAYSIKESFIRLGDFLSKNESELIQNMYTIVISNANLGFDQDLLFSKTIDFQTLKKKIHEKISLDQELNEQSFGSDFCLLKNQLVNAIITSDILVALKKIASAQEYKSLMESQVITACYYKKSDYLTKDEWFQHMENPDHRGTYQYETKIQSVEDTRSRKWTSIPLKKIIQPLLNARQECKKQMKLAKTPEEKQAWDQQQLYYKLIGNVIYGDISSPHFSTSNTVLANNITGRARLNIWYVSKPLQTLHSITDGGLYSVLKTVQRKENTKKPSISKLSTFNQLEKWKQRKSTKDNYKTLKIVPLGGKTVEEWKRIYQENDLCELNKLDQYALKCIEDFWNPYQIELNYEIEHKFKNTSFEGLTLKKAHYALRTLDQPNEIVFKFRGLSERNPSMYKSIARAFLLGEKKVIPLKEFNQLYCTTEPMLQTIYGYFIDKQRRDKKILLEPNVLEETVIVPGRSKWKSTQFRYTATDLTFENEKTFKTVQKNEYDYAIMEYQRLNKEEVEKVDIPEFIKKIHLQKIEDLDQNQTDKRKLESKKCVMASPLE